jgi:hypothetical protein
MIYLTLSLVLKISSFELFIKNTFFFDNLFLSGLWLGSLMTTFTLTGEYSRYMLPKALWASPALIKTNQIICGVWGLYFMLCAVFGFVLLNGVWTEIYWRVLSYILLAPMFVFTTVFQIWYPKRLMTQDVVS